MRYFKCLIFFFALSNLAHAQQTATNDQADLPQRVLFIGNSNTYVNNMPAVLESIAGKSGIPVNSEMIALPGETLREHWVGDSVKSVIRKGDWDFVILQEQSTLGTRLINGERTVPDPSYFYYYVSRFVDVIRKADAQPVLLLTWAWQEKPEFLQPLTHAYMTIGRELEIPVVPAGVVWQKSIRSGGPNLYMNDGIHPSPAGTYLTVLLIYETLFGNLPSNLPLHVEGVPTDMRGTVYTDSLAVLVEVTEEELNTLLSIASHSIRLLQETGNYVQVPKPVTPDLPQLPEGIPAEAVDITGVWSGPIRLLRVPAELQLTLKRDSKTAIWELLFENEQFNQNASVDDFRILGNQIRFTISDLEKLPGITEYRGVLQDNQIVGIAEYLDKGGQTHLIGKWKLTRQSSSSQAR